ncbi:MAG TPA: hypothetical protein VGF26_26985 [Ramlibacter sp.]
MVAAEVLGVPAPAPIVLPEVPPKLVPVLLDEPIVVLPGLDELVLPLGLVEAVVLLVDESVLLEADGLELLLDVEGLVLEPRLPEVPAEEPIVLAPPEPEPEADPIVLPGLVDALALLPRLRQGEVPVLEAPMPLVPESVLDPMELVPVLEPVPVLAPVPVPVVELLDEDCACTANEAAASAALAASTASLWFLVMSEVLWLNQVRTKSRPGPAAMPRAAATGRRNAAHGICAMGLRPWMTAAMGVPGTSACRRARSARRAADR